MFIGISFLDHLPGPTRLLHLHITLYWYINFAAVIDSDDELVQWLAHCSTVVYLQHNFHHQMEFPLQILLLKSLGMILNHFIGEREVDPVLSGGLVLE